MVTRPIRSELSDDRDPLEVEFSIARLGTAADQLSDVARQLMHRLDREVYPVTADFLGSSVAGAGTLTITTQPAPPLGQLWALRKLSVSGSDPTTVAAGVAYIFAGSSGTAEGAKYIDKMATLPATLYWSRFQVVMRYPEQLFVIITTPTNLQQYVVNGAAEQAPDQVSTERTP